MIKLFNKDTSKSDLVANNNMLLQLDDYCTYSKINYSLDSNHTITLTLNEKLLGNKINQIGFKQILKVKTLEGNYDYFVINSIDKTLNDIEIVGIHWVTETASNLFIIDSKPRTLNASNMLRHLKESSEEYKSHKQNALDLEVNGNIAKIVNCNAYHISLHDKVSDLQELYGCEVRKKGFELALLNKVGRQSSVYAINYGENLINASQQEDYTVVYGVLPKGYNGILGDIQYSSKIAQGLTVEKEYKVRLRDDEEEESSEYTYYDTEEQVKTTLNELARQEFTVNKIDEPLLTFDIDYADLANCLYTNVTKKTYLEVGDVVSCSIPKYNLYINVRVQKFDYNVLSQKVENVTLSNNDFQLLKAPTLTSISKDIENRPNYDEVYNITYLESTNLINSGLENSYVVVKKNEILIMDTPNINTARNIWRWNESGLMHSSTGYHGVYTLAIRQDGVITGDMIRSGVISNLSNTFSLDLERNDGITFNSQGERAININGQKMKFYDWDGRNEVGLLYSSRINGDNSKVGIALGHETNAHSAITYYNPTSDSYYPYVRFDKYNVDGGLTQYPVSFLEDVEVKNKSLYFTPNNEFYNSTSNSLVLSVNNGFIVANKSNGNKKMFETSNGGDFAFYKNGTATFYSNNSDIQVAGNFKVTGTKNCIQKTENFGSRAFYSVEDCENYLTDTCTKEINVEKTEDNTFEKKVEFDEIFKECVNLDLDYIVEIYKVGWGDYRIKEQTKNYFILESDREDFSFKYSIKAKRKGFEDERLRLEPPIIEQENAI